MRFRCMPEASGIVPGLDLGVGDDSGREVDHAGASPSPDARHVGLVTRRIYPGYAFEA